jgi:hypothetical protein
MGRIELKNHLIDLKGFFFSFVLPSTRKITRICCTALRFLNAEFSGVFAQKSVNQVLRFCHEKSTSM